MRHLFSLHFIMFITAALWGQNMAPVITNLNVSINGSTEMLITYDLEDAENNDVEITLRISDDMGQTYDINTSTATGDLGFPVSTGSDKSINWDFSSEISMDGDYRVMLVADDRQPIDIQAIVDKVDSTRLRANLEQIVGVRHRTANPAHLEDVRNLLRDRFNSNGLETETHAFTWQGYQGENIIGRKKGLTEETALYIVDGHYDTQSNTPGADDNGSAVAGVLEALRVLAPYNFERSIKFIGFDLEEEGLVGSGNFVRVDGLKPYETVEGVFNLEMIGYCDNSPNSQSLPAGFSQLYPGVYNEIRNDNFRGNFITNVGIVDHPEINEAFENAADMYVPELKVHSILAPAQWLLLTPDLGRSDHAPFWLADMPALMITDGSNFRNPNYHTRNDTLGSLNFTFMSQVVKATVATIAELAGVTNSSFAETSVSILTNSNDLRNCEITIFPNPNSAFIKLDFSSCDHEGVHIELFNLEGRKVHYEYVTRNLSGLTIPTSDFPSGTYLLSLRNEFGTVSQQVIVRE